MKNRMSKDRIIFNIVAVIILTFLSLFCILPFILIITGSITSQASILRDGYRLFPTEVSFEAYKMLFESPKQLIQSYAVTILVTVIGTFSGVICTSMAAYVLSSKDFKYRNVVSFLFYFTSIFGGGLVPWYIFIIKGLHLNNTIWAMIVPIMINVTFMLIMKSYMTSIPDSLFESARIDGAGDFKIYWSIALPLSKAAIATVGLFTALNYWNDWYNAMLFLDDGHQHLYPLQYFLHNILNKAAAMNKIAAMSGVPVSTVPSEPMKLAMTVVATGPIILLYPFLQKYFVAGVTIGAVKG